MNQAAHTEIEPHLSPESFEVAIAETISEHEEQLAAIGRALHDGLGQILSGVGLQLEALRLDYRDNAELASRIAELQTNLEAAMAEARSLSSGLNPSVVERAGLHFGLEQLVAHVKTRFPGSIRLQFPPQLHLPREIGAAFYKVAGYALEFAVSRTSSSSIDLRVKQSRDQVILEVRFDGSERAENPGNPIQRVELLMLKRHAQRAGISVVLEPAGQGTIVRTVYRAGTNTNC